MSWKRERDGLIAQTLAFVQSVAGKGGERPAPEAIPPLPSETKGTVTPSVGAAALLAVETALGTAPRGVAPALRRFEPPRVEQPRVEQPSGEPPNAASPSLPAPAPVARRPIVQSEMASEIRERIASFRAHQERFNREREEYFAATLARLRAAIKDAPPPRLRK